MSNSGTETKKVEIYGVTYPLKVDTESSKEMEKIAAHVDFEMKSLNLKTSNMTQIAVLAALNITSTLFKERRKMLELEKMVETKTNEILDLQKKFNTKN
ncbi:cell division protein ZapA [bacterium]|nr:cell division protein ZapA [bacterium]